jgi:putative phosphoribosyl transferase
MYFSSRSEAGQKLAELLQKYRYEDSAVLALSDGGVVVGAQIAAELHCPLMFLLTRDVTLPGEKTAVGVIDQNGGFTYNDFFSTGELDELVGEYHGVIDELKMKKWHELNRLLSDGGLVDATVLEGRTIIVVSDGFLNGTSLLATMNFLKPIRAKKIVIAAPFASVAAVDKMHVLGDELQVLSVIDGTFELDHYFENNDVPAQEDIIAILNEAILKWK